MEKELKSKAQTAETLDISRVFRFVVIILLRHTCASMLFKNGIDVETIASVLGHTLEMCRKTYLHLYEEQRVMAMQKLNNFDLDVLGIDATSIKPLAMR